MKRIYDAAFAPQTNESHHSHLGTFWWVDDTDSSIKGIWSRKEAHDYVVAMPNTVYVKEGDSTAWVVPYHYTDNPSIVWVETDPDGTLKDNLLTLAKRHSNR